MRKALGRIYPDDIQQSIRQIGSTIDELMEKSQALLYGSDIDIAPILSRLNARLSNEVIIPSDEITDEEARERLNSIFDELYQVQSLVNESFLIPSETEVRIQVSRAKELEESFSHANLEIYPGIIARYAKIKDALHGATVLPGVGMELSQQIRDFDRKLSVLEGSATDVYRIVGDLQVASRTLEETLLFEQPALTQIENWIGQVYATEEALKRLEAIAMKKPAIPVDYTYKTPWAVIAVGGLALLGLAAWAILE